MGQSISPSDRMAGPNGRLARMQQASLVAEPAGARAFGESLDALAARPDQAVSLGIRMPFCVTHCLCCERNIQAAQPADSIADYLGAIAEQSRAIAARVGMGRDVLHLHLGGGSMDELQGPPIAWLMDALRSAWRLPADARLSADCDPRRCGWVQLKQLASLGFRRVNFGVFDLDPAVQAAIGRFQSPALTEDVCNLARDCGFDCITLDLMIGLPQQNLAGWRQTLDRVVAIAPDRITLRRYRHQPWRAPGQCAIDGDDLPDAETCRALAEQASATLRSAGYRWVGDDQFVLDTDELAQAFDQGRLHRGLDGYAVLPSSPLIGLGVDALSDIDGDLYWAESSLPTWRAQVRAGYFPVARVCTADTTEAQRRRVVSALRCQLAWPATEATNGLASAYRQLAAREADGLVEVHGDRIVLTEAGRHVLPALCEDLGIATLPPTGATCAAS